MQKRGRLAVVGLSFRFPGPGGEGFWQALCDGRDLVTEVDAARWSKEAYLHPGTDEPGRSYTFAAGSLGDVSGFDAAFFGISPREAAHVDPQQRLLLELTWEALEAGGIRPSSLRGTRTGVMIGFSGSDYGYRHADDLDSVDGFFMTGSSASIAANRVSYFYDLRGPSLAIDTACSSALTAFHYACQSLLAGESDTAITGAANLHLHPLPFIAFSKAAMLGRGGRSRAFDASGDGYVRSEGCAIAVLKRLEDAIADGNRIYALVAGSAVNCDGRTNGLTVPSPQAQAELLTEAYARAGIEPHEIDYLEAHGTGTAVGDPIEARALGEALGRARPAGRPLRIGSIKTNLGHMETVAGMAGIVKAIFCLQKRAIPGSLHFDAPNPHIPFSELNLEVVRDLQPLDARKRLVIGVNSFGFGGANGHVILESAPQPDGPVAATPRHAVPVVISARSEQALSATARAMAEWLAQRDDMALYDIAYAAAHRRDWLKHRAIAFAADARSAAEQLAAFAGGDAAPGLASGTALEAPGTPAFVYGGNGAQWAGMGRRLLEEDATFRATVERVDALFRQHSPRSILDMLRSADAETEIESTETAQPLLFAVQAGITDTLREWGIAPGAVLGHSVGEIAAAWASGALALDDAVSIVYHRSLWQGTTRGAGGMTAVRMPADELQGLLSTFEAGSRVEIAAINSPDSLTVAGSRPALDALEAELARLGKGFARLALDYAFHSAAMDPIEPGVTGALARIAPGATRVPLISAVSGKAMDGAELGAGYWWRNIREPVRFAEAMRSLRERGHAVFLEIGPKPILGRYMAECLGAGARDCRILPTMAIGADGAQALRKRAFEAAIAGCPLDLQRFFPSAAPRVDLPSYAWQRERHWYEPSPGSRGILQRAAPHPLLGCRQAGGAAEWESRLDLLQLPSYADHRVGGEVLFPAAGFAEIALAACAALREGDVREVENLAIHAPLVLDAERSKTLRITVDDDGRIAVRGRATTDANGWRLHASGRLPLHVAVPSEAAPFSSPEGATSITSDEHYAALAAMGLEYGPAFRAVSRAWSQPGLVSAEINGMAGDAAAPMQLEPGALDACFQLIVHQQKPDPDGGEPLAFVPVQIGGISVVRPGARAAYAMVRETMRGPRSAQADCALYGADRQPIALIRDVRFRALPRREASQLVALRTHAIAKPLPHRRQNGVLPPAERWSAGCRARLHGEERLTARRRYYEVAEPLLEAMLSAFAQEAAARIEGGANGAPPDPGSLARIRRLAGDVKLPPAAAIWSELLAEHADNSADILYLGRLGLRLPEILAGRTKAETTPADTEDFGDALAQLAADAEATVPAGDRLRVLVVRPEDSALATRVAARLDPDRSDVLVSGDPASPGEAEGPIDLLILESPVQGKPEGIVDAAAMRMAPHGMLALLVPVAGPSAALAESVLRGVDEDPGARPADAAAIRAHWRSALEVHGFAEEMLIEDVPGLSAGPFLLLARAPAACEAEAPTPAASGAWLVVAAGARNALGIADGLRSELASRGAQAMVLQTQPGDRPRWEELLGELHAQHGAIAGIVELPALDQDGPTRAPRELLDRQVTRCESLTALFEACVALGISPETWIVTGSTVCAWLPRSARAPLAAGTVADDAPVWGFVRSAANEYPGLKLRLVDLATPGDTGTMAAALADTVLHPDAEDEVLLAPSGRFVPRVGAAPVARLWPSRAAQPRETTTLQIPVPGQLKHLSWVRRPLPALAEDEVEIEVRAAGLNFRDVMYAMGQLSEEALETGFAGLSLGMEHSGVVAAAGPAVKTLEPGDRVVAFAGASFGTRVVTRAGFVQKMPGSWSYEAGATVPTAFLTAYYALHHLARLQEGERVLIHGAAGGVGIAAIQIARNAGAEIFATAGTDEKRDIVRLLGADHVLNSRTLDFAGEVLERTDGRGVDVVLNSLAGEAMLRSLQLVRPLGRFLELGKRDYYENSRVGLRPFRNNLSYFGIDLDQLMRERPEFARRMMRDLIALFEEGALSPLPYRRFSAADAEAAFRWMQQSRHVGKIVLSMDPAPRADAAATSPPPALRLPSNATYLVTGGLGGFGLRTARWLANKGARHLVLMGRSEPAAQAAADIARLSSAGVRVRVERCDATDHGALQRLLEAVRAEMPPLRGIVHAAGVYRDGLMRNLDRASMEQVLAPKVLGALNLHRLTQAMPLDFFVMYSSATTTFGSPGQSNYVAANTFLEALADSRRARGLPALCVGWGPISDAGYLERNPEIREQVAARMGDSALVSAQALESLERLLAADASGLAVIKVSRASLGRLASASRAARFRGLASLAGEAQPSAVASGEIDRWLAELDDAALAATLTGLLVKEAADVLRLSAEKLDPAQPLQELGFDSLMGVELITAIEARFGVSIPVVAVSEIGTLEKLAARLVRELRRERPQPAGGTRDALGSQAQRLATLHNREMDRSEVDAIASVVRGAGEPQDPRAAGESA